ncbi:MAG: hypothetical protein WAU70_02470, partial [Flavobacteriales bacterium]
ENEDGILANAVAGSTIRITNSEFDHNGFGDGFSHNLYINSVDSLIFEGNYSHRAHIGHELKSRAKVNVIRYNRFSNEADGDASREIDLPNGGQAFIIGNVLQQGPLGENGNMVAFGLEGLTNPAPHDLVLVNNTFLNQRSTGNFLQLPAGVDLLKCYSNLFTGSSTLLVGPAPAAVDTMGNLLLTDATLAQFTNIATLDLSLTSASPAQSIGYPPGMYGSFDLSAYYEYAYPVGTQLRCQQATLDAGAYELCPTGLLEPSPHPVVLNEYGFISGPSVVSFDVFDASGRATDSTKPPAPGCYTVRYRTTTGSGSVRCCWADR